MKARVVLVSVAIHLGIVVVGVLVAAGTPREHRSLVDIEIAAPSLVTEPAPPPPERHRDPPGGRRSDPVPVRRVEPARKVLHRAPPAAPVDPTLAPVTVTPPEPEVDSSELPPGSDGPGGGSADSGGAGGSGRGTGRGDGDGAGDLDLSTPPIPLDPNLSPTLAYTEEAARRRISGDVQLLLMVDPLGRVGGVTVRRGLGHGLDEIAVKQAMQIRFRPARDRAGNATTGKVRWRYHFERP